MTEPEPEPEPVPGLDPEALEALKATDRQWMSQALAVAEKGLLIGELPIGAVVVVDGEVVGRAFTQEATQGRLLVHAELLALDQADRVIGNRRGRAVLYTTLEPCILCLGAAATTMIERVVYALGSSTDGASGLARAWAALRPDDHSPHVPLPPMIPGEGAEEARAQFRRFRESRPSPTDPLARWASTIIDPP